MTLYTKLYALRLKRKLEERYKDGETEESVLAEIEELSRRQDELINSQKDLFKKKKDIEEK